MTEHSSSLSDALARLNDLGVSPDELADYYDELRSEQTNPWEFDHVAAVTSNEPLAIARHALDARTLSRIGENGISLFTTDQMLPFATNYQRALAIGGNLIQIVRIGDFVKEPSLVIAATQDEARNRLDGNTQFNATPGPVVLKDTIKSTALDKGSSIIQLSPFDDVIGHVHGRKGIEQTDYLQTDWSSIGFEGLMALYGFDFHPKASGGQVINRIVTNQNKDPANKLEEALFKAVTSSPEVELAGLGSKAVDRTTNSPMELDAIGIKGGRLFVVEAKQSSAKNLKNNLRTSLRQLTQLTPQTVHSDRYVVLPEPLEDMKRAVESSQARNEIEQVEKRVTSEGIYILGIDEFEAILNT